MATVPPPEKLKFVKAWTVDDLMDDLTNMTKPSSRKIRKGREVFEKVQCLACHHFGGEGGTAGPDITSAVNRYSRRDLLEAILLPSKAVSDQYQDSIFLTNEDELVTGKIMREEHGKLFIQTSPFDWKLTVLAKEDIQSTKASNVSSMPSGLLDSLTQEEILNLIAYIESGADLKLRPFTKYPNLLVDAKLTGNLATFDRGTRGEPNHLVYDTAMDEFVTSSKWHEYGIGFDQDLGVVSEENAAWWQATWQKPVQAKLRRPRRVLQRPTATRDRLEDRTAPRQEMDDSPNRELEGGLMAGITDGAR